MEWVKCSDRMPDDGVNVLCLKEGGSFWVAMRNHGFWDDGDWHDHIYGITHWMPLPKPPTE